MPNSVAAKSDAAKSGAARSVDGRKAQLLARKADLAARMVTIEQELDSHHAADWEDLATEREGDEVLEGIGLSAQSELRMIDAALMRVESGEYGFCAKCGAEIGEERLDVLPFTPFCRHCAL
jgi:RNA polymerase-binding transcription factor DksA